MPASGTFTDNGKSAAIRLKPNETASVSLVSTGTFKGRVQIESSADGSAWSPVEGENGQLLSYDGRLTPFLTGTIVTTTIKNRTPSNRSFRARAFTVDASADNCTYALTEIADDILSVVLVGPKGEPILGMRDDGKIVAMAGISGGAIEATGVQLAAGVIEMVAQVTISPANIVGTSAGQFGHASGFPLVAPQGAGKSVELISAVVINARLTAAYGGGGNTTVNLSGGGAAQTGLIANSAFLAAAAPTQHVFRPLTTVGVALVDNAGLNLVTASAFTQPGTAAGVVRVSTRFVVHTTGL